MVTENIVIAIIGAIPPSIMAFLAWRTGINNSKKIDGVGINVDGKMSELIAKTEVASHSQGVIEGKIKGQEEANDRTDELSK